MKKYLILAVLILITFFYAFTIRPQIDDRPNGVDKDHWVKVNEDLGIVIETVIKGKQGDIIPLKCKGVIMFKKDNKWHYLDYQTDPKISPKFIK
jgi:hypothetical protein